MPFMIYDLRFMIFHFFRVNLRSSAVMYYFSVASVPLWPILYLKKQSQFVPGLNGAKSYLKGDYDNNSPAGDEENKAKQSQN
jgi:hypothetical protein